MHQDMPFQGNKFKHFAEERTNSFPDQPLPHWEGKTPFTHPTPRCLGRLDPRAFCTWPLRWKVLDPPPWLCVSSELRVHVPSNCCVDRCCLLPAANPAIEKAGIVFHMSVCLSLSLSLSLSVCVYITNRQTDMFVCRQTKKGSGDMSCSVDHHVSILAGVCNVVCLFSWVSRISLAR